MSPRINNPARARGGVSSAHVAVALVWFIGFTAWFHHFGLPNNPTVQRWMIWASIPFDFMDLVDPPSEPGSTVPSWSWFFLLQRIPFLLTACAIWLGAWGNGSLIIRCLGMTLRGPGRVYFSLCLGMSAVSLLMLLLGVCGQMSRWLLLVLLAVPCLAEVVIGRRLAPKPNSQQSLGSDEKDGCRDSSRLGWIVVVILVPFVMGQLLGAMSPQTDFDVVEYHLGGPKEWFQQGRIARLPHNVYTSFPFLSEMLILSGMVLYGDWEWGALAGQAVIAGFAPLTAIGLFAAGRRWFSDAAGWLGALVYLTSPWTYRISIIAYAEGGLSCYLFASLFATLLLRDQLVKRPEQIGSTFGIAMLAGLLGGSAMACKYTGLVSVVIPIGGLVGGITFIATSTKRHRSMIIVGSAFSLGVLASVGPWLLKNSIETGNPVYPLAVRVFGGKDRTEELDVKWRKAHAAKSYQSWQDRLRDLPVKLTDVVANNDWHSSLMFGLAPLSLFWCLRRREQNGERPAGTSPREVVVVVWMYVAWQFSTWWILTHHIDRFYVPMFSAVALLSGVGARWWESTEQNEGPRSPAAWHWGAGALVVATLFYNADFMLHGSISGFNAGRTDLLAAREIAVSPRIGWFNKAFEAGQLSSHPRVLCVGEALLFHARYPYLYNTVFDHSLFEQLCADPSSGDHKLLPADQIRANFRRLGVTHIDVNWAEILRYRESGNYGYTDFVHPDRFKELRQIGLIGPPIHATHAMLGRDLQKQLEEWAPSLITSVSGEPAFVSAQVFPVTITDE